MKLFGLSLSLMVAVPCLLMAVERGEEVRLWPGDAPGSEGITAKEVSTPSKAAINAKLPGNFTETHTPTLYVFLPAKGKATGAAMIVAPGGGHRQLVMEKEGWEFADWLNERGIAAFVLKYRLARIPGSKYTLAKEVHADASRAMRLVRSRAAEWGVDPGRIGFSGFSAGGEVVGMIGVKYDDGDPGNPDPIERVSSRPDYTVLIYPYYRPGSVQIVAQGPTPAVNAPVPMPLALRGIPVNLTFPIHDDAPPVFMVCTTDDPSHVIPTVKFYLELVEKKIPAEMHIYEYGEHGFALRATKKPGSPVETWPARFTEWLAYRGISPAKR